MKTILVADDNAMNQELVVELLTAWGFDVIQATTGRDTLSLVERAAPDLVLLDLQMPEMDGYAVLSQLREGARTNRIPVIAVTAYAMRGDHEKVMAAGFDGYLTKPLDFALLRSEIRKWCS